MSLTYSIALAFRPGKKKTNIHPSGGFDPVIEKTNNINQGLKPRKRFFLLIHGLKAVAIELITN
jgi:hypothetical protein